MFSPRASWPVPEVDLRVGEVVIQGDVQLPVVLGQAVQGRLLTRLDRRGYRWRMRGRRRGWRRK